MDILKDIRDILKNDREHHLKIEVDSMSIKVYLEYDPECDFTERTVIPIEYSILDEFACIPDDEYRERFRVNDYGITSDEVVLIKEIMEYLESHKKEIEELCYGYVWQNRKDKYEEKD